VIELATLAQTAYKMQYMRLQFVLALVALTYVPQVLGHAQLYFTGQKFVSGASDPTELSQDGLAGIVSTLLNIKPVNLVGSSVSQQVGVPFSSHQPVFHLLLFSVK
jgi:hypothetical protein